MGNGVLLADVVAHVHDPERAVGAEARGVDVDKLAGGIVTGLILAEGGVGEGDQRAVDVLGKQRQRVLALLALDDHEDASRVGSERHAVGDGIVRQCDDGGERGLGAGSGGVDRLCVGGGCGEQRDEEAEGEKMGRSIGDSGSEPAETADPMVFHGWWVADGLIRQRQASRRCGKWDLMLPGCRRSQIGSVPRLIQPTKRRAPARHPAGGNPASGSREEVCNLSGGCRRRCQAVGMPPVTP